MNEGIYPIKFELTEDKYLIKFCPTLEYIRNILGKFADNFRNTSIEPILNLSYTFRRDYFLTEFCYLELVNRYERNTYIIEIKKSHLVADLNKKSLLCIILILFRIDIDCFGIKIYEIPLKSADYNNFEELYATELTKNDMIKAVKKILQIVK